MNVYRYTAIIRKNLIIKGKVTYEDKRFSSFTHYTPLSSEAKVGHVLAESPLAAKDTARCELKKQYPEEKGYSIPEYVRIEEAEETIVEIEP